LLDYLNSAQLSEWEAYDRLDPIGTWRGDFGTAQIISVMINIANALYPEKGHEPVVVSPIDFMPDWTGEKEVETVKQQDPEVMKQILLGMVKSVQKKNDFDKKNQRPPTRLKKKGE
jgi:hypothetical protein